MLTYKPYGALKGSWQQALREAQALVDVLSDETKRQEYLREFSDWQYEKVTELTPPKVSEVNVTIQLVGHEIIDGKAVGGHLRIYAVEEPK